MSKPLVLDGTGKTGEIPANEPLQFGNAALSASGLTTPRTYTFPDKSGTVALSEDIELSYIRAWGNPIPNYIGTGITDTYSGLIHSCLINNYLYLCDANRNRIIPVHIGENGNLAARLPFGSAGSGTGQFASITICSLSNVLVIGDTANYRIITARMTTPDSPTWLSTFGSLGTGDSNFNNPHGVSASGRFLFVCDVANNRVKVLILNVENGTMSFLQTYGNGISTGTALGHFNFPRSILAIHDYVVVGDVGNARVQLGRFNTGTGAITWLDAYTTGASFSPHGIAAYQNYIFISDLNNAAIVVYRLNFNLGTMTYITQVTAADLGLASFNCVGLSYYAGHLYVCDYISNCVHIIRLIRTL